MANILEIVINARDDASGVIGGVLSSVTDLGGGVARVGAGMMTVAAPFVAGLGIAANAAIGFNETLTNVQAVTGYTAEATAQLGNDILDMAGNSRFAADELANAYYDVAGGVTDVTARQGILEASMHAAQAGAADLGETTGAMISIMNSYGFAAEQAGFASDVLTRTVGMGVGSMGEFASALPQVTGLANSMGIAFEDVAAGAAFLTTQGNSASQASTQLGAMMTTLMSPTAALSDIITGLGYESGQAMVDALGLAGAYGAIRQAGGGSFAGIIQNTEALRGATALTNEAFNQFSTDFISGIDGATASAEAFQMASPAAQLDMLNNSMGALAIEVGGALLPAINDIVQGVRPLITGFTQWLRANPQVVSTVIAVVGAVAGLGAGLVGIGGIISGVAGGFAALLNPITWIIGGITLLGTAFATNFMGIRDVVQPIIDNVVAGFSFLTEAIGFFISDIQNFGIGEAISMAFGGGAAGGESWVEGVIATFLGASGQASGAMRELAVNITNALGGAVSFITTTVIPGLQALVSWFITDGLPLAVGFVTGVVVPAVTGFVTTLSNIWTTVQPFLFQLIDWFITTGLPTAVNFITGTVVPAVEGFIGTLIRIWNDVSPFLFSLFDWFVNTGLPLVGSFITDVIVPVVQTLIDILVDTWEVVSPFLGQLYDWFVTNGLPFIQTAVETAGTFIQGLIDIMSGIWTTVEPVLTSLYDGFLSIFNGILDNAITPLTNALNGITSIVSGVQSGISGFVGGVGDFVGGIGQGVQNLFGGARASGGNVAGGLAYLVGEQGPELFVPGVGGSVIPNNMTSNLLSGASGGSAGGGGDTYNVQVYADTYEGGRAAADGFNTRMSEFEQERNRRG
jgi:TP901 family phage tail tape measure protein